MILRVSFGGGARRRIAQLQANGGGLDGVFRALSLDMLRASTNNFRVEGQRDEATHLWPRLSDVTIARRRKGQQKSPKILQATGRLRNSLTPTHGTNFAAVGTNVPYAPKHQQGGRWGSRMRIRETVHIPAHLATRVVGKDFDQSHAKRLARMGQLEQALRRPSAVPWALRRHRILRGAKAEASRRRRSDKARRLRQLRKTFAPAQPTTLGPSLPAWHKAARSKARLRGGKRRVKVPVRAHVQRLDYWLPARPFLWIHSYLVAKARQRLTQKLLGRKAA